MTEIATTPFGRRSLSLGMIAAQVTARGCPPDAVVHKWQVFHAICEAKTRLGVSDRALAVLNALLSFHPDTTLTGEGDLVVFPSNRHLSLRAHGMAPATLRRHLAVLVERGLIVRRDSPNGKRYARKGEGGTIEDAFGFDLAPLVARAGEFEHLAGAVKAERQAMLLLRERVTLLRRDIAKMIAAGLEEGVPGNWEGLHEGYLGLTRGIPRSATHEELKPVEAELAQMATNIRNILETHVFSRNPSAKESQSERHIQNSNPESLPESELASEKAKAKAAPLLIIDPPGEAATAPGRTAPGPDAPPSARISDGPGEMPRPQPASKTYPLGMVLEACPEIADYAPDGIRSWRDLAGAVALVRKFLGVSPSAWEEAQEALGAEGANIVIAAMLQKGEAIKSPGGYLRNLTQRARAGQFSLGPMLMALIRSKLGKERRSA